MWPQARCQLATSVLSCRHIGGDHAILLLPPLLAAPPIGAADGGGLAPEAAPAPALVAASSLARSSAPLALSLLADFAPLALAASCCLAGLSVPAASPTLGWGLGVRQEAGRGRLLCLAAGVAPMRSSMASGGGAAPLGAAPRSSLWTVPPQPQWPGLPPLRPGLSRPLGRRRAHPRGRCRLHLHGLSCLSSGQVCLAHHRVLLSPGLVRHLTSQCASMAQVSAEDRGKFCILPERSPLFSSF